MISLTLNEWITLEAFCLSCTVPLIGENNEGPMIHGTGLLFTINNHYCIITAAHVAEELKHHPDSIGVPIGMSIINEIYTFKNCEVITPKEEKNKDKYDAALILIKDSLLLEHLKRQFCFLTIENIASDFEIFNDFLVAGFPKSTAISRIKPGTTDRKVLLGDFFKFQTELYVGPIEAKTEVDQHHIFLSYDSTLVSNTGNEITAPKLEGISGCPIWTFVEPDANNIIWTPRNLIKIAAVEMSYLTNKWIRGVRWYAVAHAFGLFDPNAKDLIQNKLTEKRI